MAKAIDHNIGSGAATVAGEATKGGILGVVVAGLAGALVLGGGVAILGAAAVGLSTLLTFGAFTLPWAAVGIATGIASIFGGVGGVSAGGFIGGGVGAVLGLFKGASKVAQEKTAFDLRMSKPAAILEAREQAAHLQQAYMAGAHDGQAQLIQQIQASQEAQTSPHAQRELERRAAAAQAVGAAKGA